jgi:hypothetical protein
MNEKKYDETRCKKPVWAGYTHYQCRRKPWKDGYCKQHHPDIESAKREENRKKSDAEWNLKKARWDAKSRKDKLYEDMVSLIKHHAFSLPCTDILKEYEAIKKVLG